MAKTYTFTDIPQPTSCSAVPVSGGFLDANTTYFYRIIKTYATSSSWQGKSIPSDSFSGTTTTTDKTLRITFNTTTSAGHYKIFRGASDNSFLNLYEGPLNFYPSDATYLSGGVVTFDDDGTASESSNQFCEDRDSAHGRLVLAGSTVGDPFSIKELYDEDVAQGWGVVLKLDEHTYKVNTYLILSSSEYWVDFGKTIIFADGMATAGNWTLGRKSAFDETTYGGCNLVFKSTWLPSTTFTTLTAYRTQFSYMYPALSATGEDVTNGLGLASLSFSGLIQDCTVDRIRNFTPSNTSTINNCIFTRFDNLFSNFAATYNDVKCFNGARVWQLSNLQNVTGRGVATDSTNIVLIVSAPSSSLTTIDSISDGGIFVIGTSTGFMLYDKISYNLIILDEDGDGIEDAIIKIYNKNNLLVVDTSSTTGGTVSEQLLTWRDRTVIGTTPQAFVTYSPFKIVVSKNSYETYEEIFSITEGVGIVKNITLKTATDTVMVLGKGLALKADPTNSTADRDLIIIP